MRLEQYVVVLDACVLAPMPICDTLLRLAQEPAFYTPKWSADILEEIERTLLNKFGRTQQQVARRIQHMQAAFPDALVEGHSGLADSMTNDIDDRHVLAAAVRCGAHTIVTNNVRHSRQNR
jgi:predicted nucleic acid-binding protein